ncbi:MAG TPA: HNH endonuclease signature motif containing protein [Pyrinomonadaceae bacterium]
MSRYVSPDVRREVAARADFLREYCLIAEEDTFFGCEVEHIISLKHGGSSESSNLAYACAFCNRHKGSDIGSVSAAGEFSRFFNPRTDRWAEHFRLSTTVIQPLTVVGEVTARVLRFNHPEQLLERARLIAVGRYPHAAALARMKDRP